MKHLLLWQALLTAMVIGCNQATLAEAEPTAVAAATALATTRLSNTPTAEPTVPPTLAVEEEAEGETAVPNTPTATPAIILATAREDGTVYLNDKLLFDVQAEGIPCYEDIAPTIVYSPTQAHFLVIPACLEGDNELYLFQADGSGKQRLTDAWDRLNMDNVTWAADGQSFTYERINSCCLSPENIPEDAPPVGTVQVNIQTGEKALIATPSTKLDT